jgi:hypothetical protein
MATALEPTTRQRRKWFRRALLLGLLLLVAVGGVAWRLLRPQPLTAEEQQFVGMWAPPSPIRTASLPVDTVAYEFRADRKVIYHRHDPRTGARYTEDMGIRWRADKGQFIYCGRDPRPLVGIIAPKPLEIEMRVVWDGPDRCHMATVFHGPAGPATQDFTRIRAPEP